MSIVIIGASSGPGRLLFEDLRQRGLKPLGIARHRRGLEDTPDGRLIELDANDVGALDEHIDHNSTLIHCSRPEILTAYLSMRPTCKRLIALGSTRIYTRFPDDKCHRLTAMSHEIWMGDIPTTLLHPTMIYGAPGLNNIERIVKIAKRSPIIPLPEDGKALIQPVCASDVSRAIIACLEKPETIGQTLILAGRTAVTYREFVEHCISLAGAESRVVSVPYPLVSLMAVLTQMIPGIPAISQDEIQRLLEDKDFSINDMIEILDVEPMDLRTGLEEALG